MNLTIQTIEPRPHLIDANELERRNAILGMGGKRVLRVSPMEMAIVPAGDRLALLTPAGRADLEHELAGAAALKQVQRFDVRLDLSDVQYANGSGFVTVWAQLGVLPADNQRFHPLAVGMNGRLSAEAFSASLAGCLANALRGHLTESLGAAHYVPGYRSIDSINSALAGAEKDRRLIGAMLDLAGLELISGLVVESASCPVLDADVEQRRAAREADDQKREELKDALQKLARADMIDSAAAASNRRRRIEELEQQRIDIAARVERELGRATVEDLRRKEELASAEMRAAVERARLAEAEAVRLRQEMPRRTEQEARLADAAFREAEARAKQAEEAEKAARRQHEAMLRQASATEAMQAVLAGIVEELEVLKALVQKPAPKLEQALGMEVKWSAHRVDDDGLPVRVGGQLVNGQRLASGTMLGVSIRTTRQAFVYVLLCASEGRWQYLVPDIDGIMGIKRDNAQAAFTEVLWPGMNNHPRGNPAWPFWQLDPGTPGTERFIVLASDKPLDVRAIVERGGTQALRQIATPAVVARGICAAGMARPVRQGGTARADDYSGVVELLIGQGSVMHEMILTHG